VRNGRTRRRGTGQRQWRDLIEEVEKTKENLKKKKKKKKLLLGERRELLAVV
jgi:hypothetical protein